MGAGCLRKTRNAAQPVGTFDNRVIPFLRSQATIHLRWPRGVGPHQGTDSPPARWTPCLDRPHPRGRAAPERRSGEALLRCSPTRARTAAARDRLHSVRVPVLELPEPLRASSCYEFPVIRPLYLEHLVEQFPMIGQKVTSTA